MFHTGDHVRILIDHIDPNTGDPPNGPDSNKVLLDEAFGTVVECDFQAYKVMLTSGVTGINPAYNAVAWFKPSDIEPIWYPTDEHVAEIVQRTLEIERSLRARCDQDQQTCLICGAPTDLVLLCKHHVVDEYEKRNSR